MPTINPDGPFVKTSAIGGVEYLPGAGRLIWGEGIPEKIDKQMKKEANKKDRRITVVDKSSKKAS